MRRRRHDCRQAEEIGVQRRFAVGRMAAGRSSPGSGRSTSSAVAGRNTEVAVVGNCCCSRVVHCAVLVQPIQCHRRAGDLPCVGDVRLCNFMQC